MTSRGSVFGMLSGKFVIDAGKIELSTYVITAEANDELGTL